MQTLDSPRLTVFAKNPAPDPSNVMFSSVFFPSDNHSQKITAHILLLRYSPQEVGVNVTECNTVYNLQGVFVGLDCPRFLLLVLVREWVCIEQVGFRSGSAMGVLQQIICNFGLHASRVVACLNFLF